jgi:hypothetical protein
MPIDFAKIKNENVRRYGEDIGRIGPMLLAQRYDNRSHFIFELLQNAEDALRRRIAGNQSRAVRFELDPMGLSFSHFGEPFTEQDVRFICGIGESTETHTLTDIGRFGIGFKSVYAFTEAPEIHSGDAHFAIDSFVWPRAIPAVNLEPGQTLFRFQFRPDDPSAHTDCLAGLSGLELHTLLFLRQIEEIQWSTEAHGSGTYLRDSERITDHLRKVTLIGERQGEPTEELQFVVAERPVSHQGQPAGRVEIAFLLRDGRIFPVENATLSVFFPTIVETRFGAILQGPFRTTPSRDNIPRDDPWNLYLVTETCHLLVDALSHLKEKNLLTASALSALPIHKNRFPAGSLFHPLFEACRSALSEHAFVPCSGGSNHPARLTRLGRTKEIRELFSPAQLGLLLGQDEPLYWITEEITRDRMPELRNYFLNELGITEIDPEMVARQITGKFLAEQDIVWMTRFYEFLGKQEAAWRYTGLREKPIIRTADGQQIVPFDGMHPCVFLPGDSKTGFLTVHPEICRSEAALEFLTKLGLTTPDPVDDVIEHLLPKYHDPGFTPTEGEYASDLTRIQAALKTENKTQEARLLEKLKATPIFFAQDAGEATIRRVCASATYLPTETLRSLFEGVAGVLLLDLNRGNQKYDDQRRLARLCGAAEYLAPTPIESHFDWEELREMRRKAGCPDSTREDTVEDFTLRGLDAVLAHLGTLIPAAAAQRAGTLWQALSDLEEQRGSSAFSGTYSWFYHYPRKCTFDAAWIRQLNETRWIPKQDGTLGLPSEMVFEELSPPWKSNPYLESKIHFKPRAEVELAQMVGIEPGALDLMKKHGLTTKAKLLELLRNSPNEPADPPEPGLSPTNAIDQLLGGVGDPTPPVAEGSGEYAPGVGTGGNGRGSGGGTPGGAQGGSSGRSDSGAASPRAASSGASRPSFHTYVTVSTQEKPEDPEGLNQAERLDVEEKAISFILAREPSLRRTPSDNPGFDLFEGESLETAIRFVEVKSLKGPWSGPVALSSTQFEKARAEGERFWLYVVEKVGQPEETTLHPIQSPAGKTRHFCFDPGWKALADPA